MIYNGSIANIFNMVNIFDNYDAIIDIYPLSKLFIGDLCIIYLVKNLDKIPRTDIMLAEH